MLANFMLGAPSRHDPLPDRDDAAGWLFLARHHGLPTRLLDWTEAPLIALFFAAYPPQKSDAAIWALNSDRINQLLMGRPGIFLPERNVVGPIFQRAFSGGQADTDQVAAVMPFEVDVRMLLQLSRFTVHDSSRPLEDLVTDDLVLRKYVIPAEAQLKISAELETLGFRRPSLFPDLRTLAEYLSELHYKGGK
jgi:hypothetical protein